MTDGQIEDMNETTEAIIECCTLPMSLIIIGVGDDDFSAMRKIDEIKELQKFAKGRPIRDMV